MPAKVITRISPKMWSVAAAMVALILIVQSRTVTKGPNIHQDEVCVLDNGRFTLFQPDSDWAIQMLPSGKPVAWFPSYAGCAIQERMRALTSPSPLGPRWTSITVAVVAGALLADWLSVLGVAPLLALSLGFLLFLDPNFFSSYRAGRVDCWALALVLGACSILARLARDRRPPRECTIALLSAGALAAASIFMWQTATLLQPLVLWQAAIYWHRIASEKKVPDAAAIAWRFAAGGLLAVVMLLIPIWRVVSDIPSITYVFHYNVAAHSELTIGKVLANIKFMSATFKMSPILALGILCGIFFRRNWLLLAVTLLPLGVLLTSWAYTFRMLYVFPYLYCLAALALESIAAKRYGSQLRVALVSGLLAWAAIISLGIYTASVLSWKALKDPTVLNQPARDLIGSGPQRVFLDTEGMAFYYIGRELGWHMFRPYEETEGSVLYNTTLATFMPRVDFALVKKGATPEMKNMLVRYGLAYEATLLDEPMDRTYPYRLALGHPPYGPFLLYTRRAAHPVLHSTLVPSNPQSEMVSK